MDKVVHFEIPVDDVARAKEFYASIFEWDLQDMDMGGGDMYTTVTTVPVNDRMQPTELGAINGGIMRGSADTTAPVITIEVRGIGDAMKKIEAAGGSVVQARTEFPNKCAFAYFKDSEGNTMGLWETLPR